MGSISRTLTNQSSSHPHKEESPQVNQKYILFFLSRSKLHSWNAANNNKMYSASYLNKGIVIWQMKWHSIEMNDIDLSCTQFTCAYSKCQNYDNLIDVRSWDEQQYWCGAYVYIC